MMVILKVFLFAGENQHFSYPNLLYCSVQLGSWDLTPRLSQNIFLLHCTLLACIKIFPCYLAPLYYSVGWQEHFQKRCPPFYIRLLHNSRERGQVENVMFRCSERDYLV